MAKTTNILVSILNISSIALLICSIFTLAKASIDGFSTYMIHRDSPESPLYEPSLTQSQRFANAGQRSQSRSKRFNDTLYSASKAAEATIINAEDGAYLMTFSIGNPSKQVLVIVDTGSHLTWTQCLPCNKCISQRLPIFNPNSSYTYKNIRCGSYGCDAYTPSTFCDRRKEKCLYSLHYGDNSTSKGIIAEDTFVFRSTSGRALFFTKIKFGCGHDNFFHAKGIASGVAGLAGGNASLIRQLGFDKFGYCLMVDGEYSKTSKLHFGRDAVIYGRGVVTTPLTPRNTYYYLTLEAISVGNQRIKYYSPLLVTEGNIIIDSGSLLTLLPANFYHKLETAIANSIKERAVRDFEDWRLCYSSRFVMPNITVHFKGADVKWDFHNIFIQVNPDYVCLTIDPMQGFPIYGSVAQTNYMVGYDLAKKTLSFKKTIC